MHVTDDIAQSAGGNNFDSKETLVRTKLLIGDEAINKLAGARVAVFGIGGVGGYVCEALARSGVGAMDLIDDDTVAPSNINRQIIATVSSIGRYKTEVMRERIKDINPDINVTVHNKFFLPQTADEFPFEEYDYVVDAVDTVTAKLGLVMKAKESGVPIISSMGAGNKLSATGFMVADIYETSVCPLAKVMRRELKKRGVDSLKVVYSKEIPIVPQSDEDSEALDGGSHKKRVTPGSIAYVPSVVGLIIAGEVIKDLIK